MIDLIWTPRFSRILRRWCRAHPELGPALRERLELFEREPWHSSLKTHALSGPLKGLWAIRITNNHRLVFQFVDEAKTGALLIDIGTHDEVY
jgi:mRNA-degrading endonuclease YafQ of YafQ-DinJ toxin-antitoxin module